jgi:hypothetical protein
MILTFNEPQKLTNFFNVTSDTSSWNTLHKKVGNNQIPDRQQVFQVTNALELKASIAFPSEYGLFVLTMDIPEKTIFIGLAAENVDAPEGITQRLKKYRSHITASNLGSGVHHPQKWQTFTKARFNYFQTLNKNDDCSDVRFVEVIVLN